MYDIGKISFFFPNISFAIILFIIVIAGFIIRAWNFRGKGLFLWDEAAYYREARFFLMLMEFHKKHWRELAPSEKIPGP